MSYRVGAPCTKCGKPTYSTGRCPACRTKADRKRGSASQRGYDAAWRELRASILRADPMCQHPLCVALATDVDHIVPRNNGGSNERTNLQALCGKHHRSKTARQSSGWGKWDGASRPRGGVQWPVWHGRELILLMGAPGSGKSTYAQPFPFVVTTDALRSVARTSSGAPYAGAIAQVYDAAFDAVEGHLKRNRQVVLDTTSANPITRAHALRVAKQYRAKARLVIFTTSLDVCIQRQAGRADPVREDVVRQMHADIEAQRSAVLGEGWMQVDRNEPEADHEPEVGEQAFIGSTGVG